MRSYDWFSLSPTERDQALGRPSHRCAPEVSETVRAIFEDVAASGEAAVRRWARRLDGQEPEPFALDHDAVANARAKLEPEDVRAIEFAIDQVRFYHEATKPRPQAVETAPGVLCRRLWRPIETCGLYVPGGTAPLVSTLIMLAEPARVAGVRNSVVVTPPSRDRAPNPALIVAAAACGLQHMWLVGGAQAIAALALGVLTPKANKIFGPGNAYVAEAKRYAAALPGGPAIDLPAGPSELMVIADRSADPDFIAADLLSQAEHDRDAQVLLVSTSREMIEATTAALEHQLASLPRAETARRSLENARAIFVRTLNEAADVANLYAPEHLSVQLSDPGGLVDQIGSAGAIFVGAYSAETFGDYVAGPSHVLPTDGAATSRSGVSVASFMTSFSVQQISATGANALATSAARLARLEGLEAHARAADIRAFRRISPPTERVMRRRRAKFVRTTRETRVEVAVDLDQASPVRIETGLGFYDHMLEQVATHGGFSLTLSCQGDLEIDAHHTIEDCALALGQALKESLGERCGVGRYGFVLPMDEAEAKLSLDLSGRPYLAFTGEFSAALLGVYPTEMTEHVFRSLAQAMGATIHVAVVGENDHHKTEACFKALGRALRQAVRIEGDVTPSTKGVL